MKLKKQSKLSRKTKIILFSIVFLLAVTSAIIHLSKEPDSQKMQGRGMDCFKECAKICNERNAKVLSFTAVENKCGCTCADGGQIMFKID